MAGQKKTGEDKREAWKDKVVNQRRTGQQRPKSIKSNKNMTEDNKRQKKRNFEKTERKLMGAEKHGEHSETRKKTEKDIPQQDREIEEDTTGTCRQNRR